MKLIDVAEKEAFDNIDKFDKIEYVYLKPVCIDLQYDYDLGTQKQLFMHAKRRCQFHQHFTYEFFIQKLIRQLFLRTCCN